MNHLVTETYNHHTHPAAGRSSKVKRSEKKIIIIIYKNRYAPFHIDKFLSDQMEKGTLFFIYYS